ELRKLTALCGCLLLASLVSCGGNDKPIVPEGNNQTPVVPEVTKEPVLLIGASSESLLPTVNGGRAYLQSAPGWPAASKQDPLSPGVFIPAWDQGKGGIGNGDSDSDWVHDDIPATAVPMKPDGNRGIF